MKTIIVSAFSLLYIFLFTGCTKEGSSVVNGGNGTGGSTARFTTYGQYLYLVDQQDLSVYNLANPADPVFVRKVPVGFQIETIYPFSNRLFIGSTTAVHIFSIDRPDAPVRLSQAISPTVLRRCDPVVAKDTVAYATLRTNGACGGTQSILAVYNIKVITSPFQVTTLNVNEPYGLGYIENTLYVCDRRAGLIVYDISAAYNPQELRRVQLNAADFFDVIPFGNLLVAQTSRGMALYDITARQNPQLIKEIL